MFVKKWVSALVAILNIILNDIKECLCRIKICLFSPRKCWNGINAGLRECMGSFREYAANPVDWSRRIFKWLFRYRGCWWLILLLILIIIILRCCVPNIAPVNTVPGPQTTNENTSKTITGLSIADADAGSGSLTVTLAVTHGTLTVTGSGATISNSGTVTLAGTIAQINATLGATVTYVPVANYSGADTLTMATNDNGHAGTGGPKTDTDVISITVNPADSPPIATNLSTAQTYTEDTPLPLTAIVVSDVDSANVMVTLTLSSAAAGSLNTGSSGAVTSTFVAGVWTASGAIGNVNTLLAGLTFTPSLNYNSNFTIATSVSDGVAPAVIGSKAMTGIAVNDPPTATIQTGLPIVNNTCPQPPPQGIISGSTISATASDPETPESSLNKQWTGGLGQIIFTTVNVLNPTVSLINGINSSYVKVTLTVTDPGGLSSSNIKCIKLCRSSSSNCP